MPPRLGGAAAPPTVSKVLKKERIVQALTRMNDRDTQKAAAEDLLSIVLNMDQEGLPIILSCLCTTGSEHKVYARKECSRAVGLIASDACPLHEQALQQPHLGKMLGQLRKSLQDADSSVREASSEAVALVAQGLAQLGLVGTQGSLNNPVLKLIFDCLVEQKKEMNTAACVALGMAAPYIGTLDSSLSRELVRKLNNASFQASAALLAALARTDPATGEPIGLMKSGPAAFVPLLPTLVGQPAQPLLGSSGTSSNAAGTGVVGALSRPDWPVRLAAADMLRATALLLGPLMEMDGCWTAGDPKSVTGRAIRGLESCRFDKVRDVRDVARAALAVLEELHEYGSGGGSAGGWPAHISMKLYGRDVPLSVAAAAPQYAEAMAPGPPIQGRKSPVRRSGISPGRRARPTQPQTRASHPSPPRRSPTPPERRSSPIFARAGSLSERFRAAHRDGDIVSVHYPGGFDSEPLQGGDEGAGGAGLRQQAEPVPRPPVQAWPQDDTLPDAAQGSRAVSRQPSKAASNGSRAVERPLSVEPLFSVRSRDTTPPQQAGGSPEPGAPDPASMMESLGLEDDALAMMDADGPPTFSRNITEPSRASGAPLDRSFPAPAPAPGPPPAVFGPGASASAGPVPVSSVMPPLPSASSLGPTVTVPTEEWLAAQQRLRALEAQHRQLLDAFNSMSVQSRQAIIGLQAKVRSLETVPEVAQSQPAMASKPPPLLPPRLEVEPDSELSWLSRTIRPGSPMMPPTAVGGNAAGGRLGAYPYDAGAAASPPVSVQMPGPSPSPPNGQEYLSGALSAGGSTDVRQAYSEALSGGRMQLLRVMQRTGPIWNDLGHDLASQLLAFFTVSLQQARADGPMLSRMMPWLWRLADDDNNRFEAPHEMRAPMLAALRLAQTLVTEPTLYDRVGLLVSTLRTHWSLPEPVAGAPRSSPGWLPPPQQPMVPVPSPPAVGSWTPPVTSTFSVAQSWQSAAAAAAAGSSPSLYYPAAAAPAPYSSGASMGAYSGTTDPAAHATTSITPTQSQSPQDAPTASSVTPRLAALRNSQQSSRTPSISTLMGQWSDLQRDFAAMSSPAAKAQARAAGQ